MANRPMWAFTKSLNSPPSASLCHASYLPLISLIPSERNFSYADLDQKAHALATAIKVRLLISSTTPIHPVFLHEIHIRYLLTAKQNLHFLRHLLRNASSFAISHLITRPYFQVCL